MSKAAEQSAKPQSRFWMLIPFVLFAGLSALFYERLTAGGDPAAVPSPLLDKPVPEFTLANVEGLAAKSGPVPGFGNEDLIGSVSVINIWGSWCGPCRVEHPILMELAEKNDVPLYGINYKDEPKNAIRFLDTLGNPFVAVGADKTGRTSIDWGVYGVPETFVVNASGCITYKHVGPLTKNLLAKKLLPAIEAAKASQADCRAQNAASAAS